MLQVSAWVRIVVATIIVAGILFAMPNALPDNIRAKLPSWLPTSTVSLGLDLQGGSSVLLEVEFDQVIKDRMDSMVGDIRRTLRKEHVAYKFIPGSGETISVQIIDTAQFDTALELIKGLNSTVGGATFGGARQYDITQPGQSTVTLKMSDAYKKYVKEDVVSRSIEVVRKRVDELGTKEPSIEQQGSDRIIVQVPGLRDPSHLLQILQTTAKMTFQMVDDTADTVAAMRGAVPIGDELLPEQKDRTGQQPPPVLVEKRVLISGDRLKDAGWTTDQQTGLVVVTLKFDSVGAKEFADITKDNVGRRFAIVLDKTVLTAPRIDEPILGGQAIIKGSFTVQTANDLAAMLRAGALPAPLKPIEQTTVGPELGRDSIDAGSVATVAGLILVAFFMFLRYGLFGIFADIAMGLNLILLLAVLTTLGATLTLPGIAGIVLTMGMAVDANVLIFERMREEQRNGRSMLGSIDTGERRAIATIIDANATHLIAALILFELGSGPVRGFAVTLGLGIITSFFTAVMVTRLIVIGWLHVAKPKKLII
ncbi:MAG: protein translocase subunit SecD [Alphaproteobacteria bacterium]|nr:protein translocase subunit SecD [Alphaproteobacteria bacterium]